MSEMSRAARRAMRAKIHRITQANSGKVDASDYGPEEVLDAGVKTGMRPISRRAYKKGGKVVAVEGKDAKKNAGKKPRGAPKHLTVDALVNRNLKDANEDREGIKHIGGLKRGGRAGKAAGGTPDAGVPTERFGFSGSNKGRVAQALGFKKGGRTERWLGGANTRKTTPAPTAPSTPSASTMPRTEEVDSMGRKELEALGRSAEKELRKPIVPGRRKHGGKAWEGSAKDEAQDKKLAKKHGMSMKKWEASALDKKHDKQHSTKGLKSGGRSGKSLGGDIALGAISPLALGLSKLGKKREDKNRGGMAMDGEYQGTRPKGGRIAKRDGGSLAGLEMNTGGRAKRKGKGNGKTDINIVISTGKGGQSMPQGLAAGPAGMPIPVPGPNAGPGLPVPPAMPSPQAAAGALGGGSPVPLARKRGGRTYRSYKDMDAGAGSGLGRLEKTEIQKHKK